MCISGGKLSFAAHCADGSFISASTRDFTLLMQAQM